jgi:hypothetical protein
VSKQKIKKSKKSRDTQKNKKTIKRKSKISAKSSSYKRVPHLLEYASARRISEVVLEFAEPLTAVVDDVEGEEKAIRLSIILWNVSLLSKQKAVKTIRPIFDEMTNGDQVLKSEFLKIFEMMYERKQSYFLADNRFIADYNLEENREGWYLQVTSTPLKS